MANLGSLQVNIEGDAKDLMKVLDKVNKQSNNTAKTLNKNVGGEATSGFSNLGKSVAKASAVLGGAGAAAGAAVVAITAVGKAAYAAGQKFVSWFSATAKGTRKLERNAKAAGIGVEEYQALSATFQRFNADADDLQDVLGTLADRAQDAASGAKGPQEDFALLGIAVDDLRSKRPAGLLDEVANGLKNVDDPSKRMAAAARILGDDLAKKLVPLLSEGADGLKEFKEEARKSGQVLSGEAVAGAREFIETMDRLQRTIEGIKKTVFASFTPAMNLIIKTIQTAVGYFSNFQVSIEFAQRVLFQFTKKAMVAALDSILALNKGFQKILSATQFFNDGIKASAKMIVAFGQGFEAVKLAVTGTISLIKGFVQDVLSSLIDKLGGVVGFLADMASAAGMDGLAGTLRDAKNTADEFSGSLEDMSSKSIKESEKSFEKSKKAAERINKILNMDLKNSLDKAIEKLSEKNKNLANSLKHLRAKLQNTTMESVSGSPQEPGNQSQSPAGAPKSEGAGPQVPAIDLMQKARNLWGGIASKAKEWRNTVSGWVENEGAETKDQTDDILDSWKNLLGAVGQVGSSLSRLPGISDKVGVAVDGITGAMITVLGTIQASIAASGTLATTLAAATGGLSLIAGVIGTVASLAAKKKNKPSKAEQKQERERSAREVGKTMAEELNKNLDRRPVNVTIDGARFGAGAGSDSEEEFGRFVTDLVERETQNRPNSVLNGDS